MGCLVRKSSFFGVMHHTKDLLSITTSGNVSSIDIKHQVTLGQWTQEPSIDILPTSVGEEANLLFTILSTIEAFADFTDVLAGKTTNVEFMKEGGTLFLLFKDAEYHWAKSP